MRGQIVRRESSLYRGRQLQPPQPGGAGSGVQAVRGRDEAGAGRGGVCGVGGEGKNFTGMNRGQLALGHGHLPSIEVKKMILTRRQRMATASRKRIVCAESVYPFSIR